MNKLLGLFTLLFFGFVKQDGGRSPELTELKIKYGLDACSAPLAVFDISRRGDELTFSFGHKEYLEKQDTIAFSFRNDTLFLSIVQRNAPTVIVRNGVPVTVYQRDDPDCECNSLVQVKFSGVRKMPGYYIIDRYIHDETFGLVDISRQHRLREMEQSREQSGKFRLDSLFEVKPGFKGYPNLQDLPRYLEKRGTLALVAVDVDTPSETLLVERIQRELWRRNLICDTRTQCVFQADIADGDTSSVWVKLIDTRSFKFPDYIRKRK